MKSQCQTLTLKQPATRLSDYPGLYRAHMQTYPNYDPAIPEGYEPFAVRLPYLVEPAVSADGSFFKKGLNHKTSLPWVIVRPVPDTQVKWWEDSGGAILDLEFTTPNGSLCFGVFQGMGKKRDLSGVILSKVEGPFGDTLGESVCAPEDEFDFETGAYLALDRARVPWDKAAVKQTLARIFTTIRSHQLTQSLNHVTEALNSLSCIPPELTQTTLDPKGLPHSPVNIYEWDGGTYITQTFNLFYNLADCQWKTRFSRYPRKRAFKEFVDAAWTTSDNRGYMWDAYFEAFPEDKRRG